MKEKSQAGWLDSPVPNWEIELPISFLFCLWLANVREEDFHVIVSYFFPE